MVVPIIKLDKPSFMNRRFNKEEAINYERTFKVQQETKTKKYKTLQEQINNDILFREQYLTELIEKHKFKSIKFGDDIPSKSKIKFITNDYQFNSGGIFICYLDDDTLEFSNFNGKYIQLKKNNIKVLYAKIKN